MTKYNPLESRIELNKLTAKNVVLSNYLRCLYGNNAVVANAILRGKTVSNLQYEVGADIEIARCDAVIGELRRKYFLPISRQMISVVTESGHRAKRAKYFIDPLALKQLFSDPVSVLKGQRKRAFIARTGEETRAINRLSLRYGKSGAIKRVVRHTFKSPHLSKSRLERLVVEIDKCCERAGVL